MQRRAARPGRAAFFITIWKESGVAGVHAGAILGILSAFVSINQYNA